MAHGHPIGALYSYHSFNHHITGSAKCPPKKQTSSHWTVETLSMECNYNKIDFSFCAKVDGFADPVINTPFG